MKCVICGGKASLMVRGTNNYYCTECAEELFGEVQLLVEINEEAKRLKQYLDRD